MVRIYRGTARNATYSLAATVASTDSAFYDRVGVATSWYQVAYYDSLTASESDRSIPIPAYSFTNYVTVVQVQDFLNLFTEVTSEAVGTGTGSAVTFDFDYKNVVENSEKVYVAGTQVPHDRNYFMQYDDGRIVFQTGYIPTTGQAITADYKYSDPSNSVVAAHILRAEDEINRIAGRTFYAPQTVVELYTGDAKNDSALWRYDGSTYLDVIKEYLPSLNEFTENKSLQLKRYPVKSIKFIVKDYAIDQQYGPVNVDAAGTLGSTRRLSQGFTPTATTLSKVRLWLKYNTGTTQPITVTINSNNSGVPSSTVLGTAIIDPVTVTQDYDWYDVVFDQPITLTAGTVYHIVVYSAASSTSSYHWGGDSTSATYSGGTAALSTNSGSSWTAEATTDRAFQTWGGELITPDEYVVEEDTGRLTFTTASGEKFARGIQNFLVRYSHGYDTVPKAVEDLALKMTAKRVIESRLLGSPSQSLNIQAQNLGILDKDVKELWEAVGRYFELKPVTQ